MYLQKNIPLNQRRCYQCHEIKSLHLFPDNKSHSTGKKYKCTKCCNLSANEYRKKNLEYFKQYRKNNKERLYKLHTDWLEKHPEQKQAYTETREAIRKGVLKRQPCIVCTEPKSEAHHNDYTKPLSVIWLCREHHSFIRREHNHHYSLGTLYIMQGVLE